MKTVDPSDPDFSARARAISFIGVDFDGVMTDNTVYVFEDGREAVRCSRLEGFGLRRAERAGVELVIISTEVNRVVSARAKKLKLHAVQAVEDKVASMGALLAERGLSWEDAGFIGNDLNDVGVLEKVRLPIVVADAHEDLNGLRAFRTRRVGGSGCVREMCDAVALAREAGAK